MSELINYVNFLRALASEERLSILETIENEGEVSVNEIQKRFFMEQSTASHHLNILKKATILECRKKGRNMLYHINENSLDKTYQEFMKKLHEKQQEKIEKKDRQLK